MIIRRAILKDKKQLRKLLEEFYVADKKRFSERLQEWEKYKNKSKVLEATTREYLSDKNFFLFVAEEKGILKGYICGDIKKKVHKIYDKEGYVQDWFVEEDVRNKKIGKKLFDTLVDEFKKEKCTHIALDAFVENKKAIDIYHAMGFQDKLLVMRKDLI